MLTSPDGERFTQATAAPARRGSITWWCCADGTKGSTSACGRTWRPRAVSIGDYVVSGGELPALVIVDAVARLVPGVVGDEQSVARDTFARGLLDYPQYTRPADYGACGVPPGAAVGAPSGYRAVAAAGSAGAHARAASGPAGGPALDAEDAALLKELQGRVRPEDAKATEGRDAGAARRVRATVGGPAEIRRSIVMNAVETVERSNMVKRPAIKPGDTVKVHVKVREGDKERIQVFEGMVIGMHRGGARATFTVRKVSFGQGVERIFPLHSPIIDKIDVVRTARVRRAKLYFLRELKGKAARMKDVDPEAATA